MPSAPPTWRRPVHGWTPSTRPSTCRRSGFTPSLVAPQHGNLWYRSRWSAAPQTPSGGPQLHSLVVRQIHLGLHLVKDPVALAATDQQPGDPARAGPFDGGLPAGQAPLTE